MLSGLGASHADASLHRGVSQAHVAAANCEHVGVRCRVAIERVWRHVVYYGRIIAGSLSQITNLRGNCSTHHQRVTHARTYA